MTTGMWKGVCTVGKLQVFSPDGTRYDMDASGPQVGTTLAQTQSSWYPSRITDRNGNAMTITYTPIGALGTFGPQSVTTSDGRSLAFTYTNGALTSVSDGTRTIGYTTVPVAGKPGFLNLTSVTRPDGLSWTFDYNSPGAGPGVGAAGGYSMKKAIYPTGGQIQYVYSFVNFNGASFFPAATVVTTKTAGTDIWQYAYTPAVNPLGVCTGSLCPIDSVADADKLDKTTVNAPDGNVYVYQHIGYTSASSGYVFLIGSLIFKKLGGAQSEGYSWAAQKISDQPNQRPGGAYIADAQTNHALLAQKQVSRTNALFTTQYFQSGAVGFGFDAFGNPLKITETGPDAGTGSETRVTDVTYFVDETKWIIHQKKDETTDTIGSIARTFDANGNLQTENRYGVTTSFTYTPEGDVESKTDANLNKITYGGYFRGVPQTEGHPEGVNISRTVSAAGNVLSETDGELATTSYDYDGLNRITAIRHPLGNPVGVTWAATSRTVDRGLFHEVTAFDAFGRRISVAHADGQGGTITQTFGYDPMGRRTFVSYPNSTMGTHFDYSAADHLLTVKHVSDMAGTTTVATQAYGYARNTVQLTNERGKVFLYTYRGWGDPGSLELMKIDAPVVAASVTMQRNGLGKLTSVTQEGVTRSYGYDAHYFLTSTTEPEVGVTMFGRDAVGNMTSRQVGTAPSTSFGYDGRNRLKTITYPVGTVSVSRSYFRDDKISSVDNGVARREFTYDANKNLKAEKLVADAQTFMTSYSYDGNDALSAITYGSGKTVAYAPDALGRPTAALPYVTSVTHHPTGQVKHIVYANGVQTDIALNNRNWPSDLVINQATQYFNLGYAYEGNGDVSAILDNGEGSWTRFMAYDGIDRLTNVNGPWGTGTIAYDGRGNITRQSLGTSVTIGYTYDATEKLASTVGTKAYTFTYDAYGNVTGNGVMSFGYNDASQMKCAKCGQAGEVTYAYDGLGLRMKTLQGTAATYFVYDANGRLMSEKQPDGTIKEYAYLAGQQIATRTQAP